MTENNHVGSELVQKGLTLTRIENETQQAMAIQKPRREDAVIKGALDELKLVPKFASKAFYSIPYKNDQGGTTNIEGPSIKAAMALARRWGNCSNGGRVVEERDSELIVEGVFLDYETNVRTLRQVRVPKTYWSKKSKTIVPLRDDRLNIAVQAGISKAVRNAILASLPAAFVDEYVDKAKTVAVAALEGPKTARNRPQSRLEAAKARFKALGVSEAQFEAFKAGSAAESEEALLKDLLGLYNAIEDGSARIEDVFPPEEQKPIEGAVKKSELFDKS